MIDSFIKSIRGIIEFIVIVLAYRQIFNASVKKNKFIIVTIGALMGVCYFVNSYFNLNVPYTVVGVLYAVFIPLVLLEGNKKKWLSLYPTIMLLTTMSSMAISYMVAFVFKLQVVDVYYDSILSCLVDISFLCIILIDYGFTKKNPTRRITNYNISPIVYFIMTIGEFAFVMLLGAMQYYTQLHEVKSNMINAIGFTIAVICVVYGVAFLFLSVYIQKNTETNKEKDMLNLYVSEQQKHIELMVEKDQDMKKFRHDVRQHMWVVSYHIEQGEIELAKDYINQIYENLDSAKMEHYTGAVPIDVVLSDKKKVMDEKKIKFNWSGSVNKIPGNIQEYDICTVFIAIIDNAIEACESLMEDERELKLLVEINNGKLYIMEKHKCNSCNQSEENPGIRAIAEKYDGYVIYTNADNNYMVEVVL